jgi:hypothetical protein
LAKAGTARKRIRAAERIYLPGCLSMRKPREVVYVER